MSATSTTTKTTLNLKTPSQWKVILLNDDFTPIEFVIDLLMMVFNKTEEAAEHIAQTVHTTGDAQIGLYTKEVANTKVDVSRALAEQKQYPLRVKCEEA